jgi:Lrp/AsnC family leucine-responsive transcriptional regulator
MEALDKIDRLILRTLQADGRATYDQLAEQVSLSPSAVLRRVKRLEESRVIDRYVALVQPEAIGLGLTAYLNVRLEKHTESHKRNPMDLFRASVQTWPEVVECAALTGDMDYLLRVVVATWRTTAASSWTPCSSTPAWKTARPASCWTVSRPQQLCLFSHELVARAPRALVLSHECVPEVPLWGCWLRENPYI